MNRPNYDEYEDSQYEPSIYSYSRDLEDYCDSLEKALDKACELLSIYATNEEDGVEEQIHTSDEWKELFLGGKE